MIKRRFFVAECRISIPLWSILFTKNRSDFQLINNIIFLDIRNLYTYMSIGKCLENESYFSIAHSSLLLNFKQVSKSECNTWLVESQLYLFAIRANSWSKNLDGLKFKDSLDLALRILIKAYYRSKFLS